MTQVGSWPLRIAIALWLAAIPAIAGLCADEVEEAPQGSDDYVLGVEDKLTVVVWKEPDLSRTVIIRPDGRISLPLLGELEAAGRSTRELGEGIRTALARYIREPVVAVVVEEINSFKVYMLGEVKLPGVLVLRRKTRFLHAIALAGGFTQFADKSNVQIIREENGGRELRIKIDYRKVANGERPDMNVYLKPGDSIVVN